MDNIQKLKEKLQLFASDEILDLFDEVETEFEELTAFKEEHEDIGDLTTINLGLDTIHFTFEKGNLQIRQQFDCLMQVLCKTPNAVI